ncbi:MAG TPA: hypothetical protein VKX40_12920 [Aequorivita sp.]|nr:hypothetical protein [Aequorivita sp.]
MTTDNTTLFAGIEDAIKSLSTDRITDERKAILKSLVEYIQTKVEKDQLVRLNFICTHNSRRSHLSQVWAQALSYYFGLKNVICYSGGTEVTAFFPMAVETLRGSGFKIQMFSEGNNPIYSIKYAANEHPILGFSKRMDDDFNPKSEFAAIITCDAANEACPIVEGAEKRIPITYEDPKAFDDTPLQVETYKERSLQIATELFYVFSHINLK